MNTAIRFGSAIVLLAVIFLAGYGYGRWYAQRNEATSTNKEEARILYWVDPMHPAYKSDKPGVAPDCGMRLVPVYADHRTVLPEAAAQPNDASMSMGTIQVAPEKQQLIGVRYGVAELTSNGGTIRAVGKVAPDETRVTRVHPKVEGWIQKVHVDFSGQHVRRGDPLLTVYSPEMLATEQEFLLALQSKEILAHSSAHDTDENGDRLLEASRRRLELWDLSSAQINQLERTRQTTREVTLYSPAAGFVLARNAFPSQRITPETELYAIADLSRVWIMADVFESDMGQIRIGEPAEILLPYQNGKSFSARVDYIQPEVDPATRTLKIRLEASNWNGRLKPDMFVNVEFHLISAQRVTVPKDAVLDSGLHKTIFVDRGHGYLEPREVETGKLNGDRIEVLKGLQLGERIVTSGTFLIDSESRLKAAAGGMAGMPGMPGMSSPKDNTSQKPAPKIEHSDHSMPNMPGMEPKHD